MTVTLFYVGSRMLAQTAPHEPICVQIYARCLSFLLYCSIFHLLIGQETLVFQIPVMTVTSGKLLLHDTICFQQTFPLAPLIRPKAAIFVAASSKTTLVV